MVGDLHPCLEVIKLWISGILPIPHNSHLVCLDGLFFLVYLSTLLPVVIVLLSYSDLCLDLPNHDTLSVKSVPDGGPFLLARLLELSFTSYHTRYACTFFYMHAHYQI